MRKQMKHFLAAAVFTAAALTVTANPYAMTTVSAGETGLQIEAAPESESYGETRAVSDFVIDGSGRLTEYKGAGGAVVIPSTVKTIGNDVFEGNNTISSVTIPSSVKVIESSAFRNCQGLRTITFNEGLQEIQNSWSYGAFEGCIGLQQVTLPKSLKKIDQGTFEDCTGLRKVTFKTGTASYEIPDYCFYNCTGLYSVTLSGNTTAIGSNAFYGTSLEEITIPSKVTKIGRGAFRGTALTSVDIPSSVQTIYQEAFYNCTGLSTVTLHGGLKKIEGASYQYGAFQNTAITSITIPSTVTNVGEAAFQECKSLKEVKFTSGVAQTIDDDAFYGCTSLSKVTLSNKLVSIGNSAFYKCALTSLNIPSSVVKIGSESFKENEKLTTLTLNEGLVDVGSSVFAYCKALKSVKTPSTMSQIPSAMFYDCTSLEKVEISEGVTIINGSSYPGGAFESCTSLKSVSIPTSVTKMGNNIFAYCKSLTNITIPSSVTSIGDGMFSNCLALEKAYIPKSVTSFGYNLFYNTNYVTIYGVAGSKAQEYAASNSIAFKATLNATRELNATVKNGNCAALSWEKVSGAQGYIVYRATGSGSFAYVGMTSGLSFSDKKVTKGNTYSYKVYPYYVTNGERILGPADIIKSVKILKASAGLKVTSTTNNSVSLSWNKTTGADGYIIYRRVADGSFKYLYMVSGTTYTDKKATNYQYNFYRVYPYYVDADGNRVLGTSGNYVYSKPLPSVTGLKAVGNKGNVTISWNKTANTTGYFVYKKNSSGKFVYVGMSTGSSFVDKTASKTSYNFYRVYPYYKATANSDRIMGKSLSYVYAKAK